MTRPRTGGRILMLLAVTIIVVIVGWLWQSGERMRDNASSALTHLSLITEFDLGFTFDGSNPRSWIAAGSEEAGLLVAYDASVHLMRVHDLTGRLDGSFGGHGMLPGEFMSPSGLDLDDGGSICVADDRIPVIRCYTRKGELVREYPEIDGVWGWGDVCCSRDVVVASPNVGSAFVRRRGIYVFGEHEPKAVCKDCYGPVTVDSDGNIYVLNWFSKRGRQAGPVLTGMTSSGHRMFARRHEGSTIRPDVRYWPKAGCLVLVNQGRRRVEAYRMDGASMGCLLEVPADKPPPIAAIPIGSKLYVVHIDGSVEVYEASV